MKNCALLTCANLEAFIHDEHLLEAALRKEGWHYQWLKWKEPLSQPFLFDCVIVRTTWDYTHDLPCFISQMAQFKATGTILVNSFEVIRWNSQKTYLRELAERGIATIATLWIQFWRNSELEFLFNQLETDEVVIKPQIGAGSFHTFHLKRNEPHNWPSDLNLIQGKAMMAQAFLPQISEEGEYSAIFFGDQLSHCILKKPKAGDYRSQEEYGSFIKPVVMLESMELFCRKVLEVIPHPYFFARVDFVRCPKREWQLMELELVEPSLYFRFAERSADLFVKELQKYLS